MFGRIAGYILSFIFHLGMFYSLIYFHLADKEKLKTLKEAVKIKIIAKKPKVVDIKPKPKPKPKVKPKPKSNVKKSTAKTTKPKLLSKPVQGFKKSAFSSEGTGIAVPVGNSLMEEDKGLRLKKEPPPVAEDLSQRAKLMEFIEPEYTDDALDVELEGDFVLDVFIDKNGKVLDVEIDKPVGYGMDDLLIAAAMKAIFSPRLNKKGISIPGWDQIIVRLEIP